MTIKKFKEKLEKAATENQVRDAYARFFEIEFKDNDRNDLSTDTTLFEFKLDRNLSDKKPLAATIAQALYYVHRAKYGITDSPLWNYTVVADKNEAAILSTKDWSTLYTSVAYDWSLAPSSPDPKLVDAVIAAPGFSKVVVYDLTSDGELDTFAAAMKAALLDNTIIEKKLVTGINFESVFLDWQKRLGALQPSIFLADLKGAVIFDQKRGILVVDKVEHHVPAKDYETFWSIYERPSFSSLEEITSKLDRLDSISHRRFIGKFYTPILFAGKALEVLAAELGEEWYKDYYLWDMAAGTGNLEWALPSYDRCFLSTLEEDEVAYLKENFAGATSFQYDYLNDDVEKVFSGANLLDDNLGWKLPRELREKLADKTTKWVVLLNPPFAETSSGLSKGADKTEVASSKVGDLLEGKASRELYQQFLHRIAKELPSAQLGLFATLKYINAQSAKDARVSGAFRAGFMFPSSTFEGTKGNWPVSFALWELGAKASSTPTFDILDKNGDKVGKKVVEPPKNPLNKWVKRPDRTEVSAPLKNSVDMYPNPLVDRVAKSSIGYMCVTGNDIQQANVTFALSSVYGNGAGFSITPTIFDETMIVWAVRKLVEPSWANDRDQFSEPSAPLDPSFITDCLIHNLFHSSNQTSSLKDLEYKGKLWDVRNSFFPYPVDEVKGWAANLLSPQLKQAKDTFVAEWLKGRVLSAESSAVLDAGRKVYQAFWREVPNLNLAKWKIAYWDVGWYQVRMSLKEKGLASKELDELKAAHKLLVAKLRPMVYSLGFLPEEEWFQ